MRVQPFLTIALLLAVAMSGCLGTQARSEWAYDVTQLDDAYAGGKRGSGVVVAVLDTGINVEHPSLSHLVDGNANNGELMGFRDYINNRNGIDKAYDDAGHGTHVAGIISARGSNFGDKLTNGGVDLLGGSPNVGLLIAKVCTKDDTCENSQIATAISWAADSGADIISLSLGGEGGLSQLQQVGIFQDEITREINEAIDQGIVVVSAAGNFGPESNDVAFPAVIQGVIAVGAINEDLRVASFSNHGDGEANTCTQRPFPLPSQGRCPPHQKPEVVAPGTEILSAWTGSLYVRASGTSQATPFVTSAVALMLEGQDLRDRNDVVQVKSALRSTAQKVAGQTTPHDNAAGYGIVQAQAAIQAFGG